VIPYGMYVSRSGVAEFLQTAIHLLHFTSTVHFRDILHIQSLDTKKQAAQLSLTNPHDVCIMANGKILKQSG